MLVMLSVCNPRDEFSSSATTVCVDICPASNLTDSSFQSESMLLSMYSAYVYIIIFHISYSYTHTYHLVYVYTYQYHTVCLSIYCIYLSTSLSTYTPIYLAI